MKNKNPPNMEKLLEQARELATKDLQSLINKNEELESFMVMAMMETTIGMLIENLGPTETAELLRDLAEQIEEDNDEDLDTDFKDLHDNEDLDEDEDYDDDSSNKDRQH